MRRYLIPILIISTFVLGFVLGCNSAQLSATASSQESSIPAESTSSEYQQQINELEQQIYLLDQRVDTLDKELEQKVASLTQQLGNLGENINSLEHRLETLSVTDSSDVEVRIKQQIAQLGEQVVELEERLDGLNAEVAVIKQPSTEQGDEGGATSPPPTLTPPPGTIFTFSGQGNSRSLPFTIGSSPWKLMLYANLNAQGATSVNIEVVDPTQYEPSLRPLGVGSCGFIVEQGISIRETVLYVPAGTYFLDVDTHYATTWTVWVVEL